LRKLTSRFIHAGKIPSRFPCIRRCCVGLADERIRVARACVRTGELFKLALKNLQHVGTSPSSPLRELHVGRGSLGKESRETSGVFAGKEKRVSGQARSTTPGSSFLGTWKKLSNASRVLSTGSSASGPNAEQVRVTGLDAFESPTSCGACAWCYIRHRHRLVHGDGLSSTRRGMLSMHRRFGGGRSLLLHCLRSTGEEVSLKARLDLHVHS